MKKKRPYIIAEMGVNFYDTAKVYNITPLEAAKKYIDEAARVGVDCVKFQSYKAETIVSKNSPAYWDLKKEPTKTQFELFQKHDKFNKEDYIELCSYAHKLNLDFTSTPFDYESADYLEPYVDFYKISSSDLSNLPFIEHIAMKMKPIVLSVGASYLNEVDEAVRTILNTGNKKISLLHCVLSYPTKIGDANLLTIKYLKSVYPDIEIGYSDHVTPDRNLTIISTAYLLGATIIEKHFTLDKTLEGNDHYHSGSPEDFKQIIDNLKIIDKSLGKFNKTVLVCEENSRLQARRSIVLKRNMKAGQTISENDIIAKRPGTGISPKFIKVVLGRKVAKDLKEDTILQWDMLI